MVRIIDSEMEFNYSSYDTIIYNYLKSRTKIQDGGLHLLLLHVYSSVYETWLLTNISLF